ncbi:PREDICTED: uncharacterized protein LOC106814962 isoform X2 [Priapulus caudatus]|nr:PREDICTED: uncharacterized protein LOC106814962 isoform X2 [Priapulus caudatus]
MEGASVLQALTQQLSKQDKGLRAQLASRQEDLHHLMQLLQYKAQDSNKELFERQLKELLIQQLLLRRIVDEATHQISEISIRMTRSCGMNGGSSLLCDLEDQNGPGNTGGAVNTAGAGR